MRPLALAALILPLAAPAIASAADGRELYGNYCASCHGEDGRGHTARGRRMGLRDLATTRLTAVEIERLISYGRGKMPGLGSTLTPEEIGAVAAVVKRGL